MSISPGFHLATPLRNGFGYGSEARTGTATRTGSRTDGARPLCVRHTRTGHGHNIPSRASSSDGTLLYEGTLMHEGTLLFELLALLVPLELVVKAPAQVVVPVDDDRAGVVTHVVALMTVPA
jgi:hypothetical protein